jgi:hypothetical protein
VNRLAQKVKSFSASPELLASSFDPRLCDEKNPLAPAFGGDASGSGAIFLFDHNLFKAVPLFCRRCPDIAFYRPHHAGPLGTREYLGMPWPEP